MRGVDARALLRAARPVVVRGSIVSGGSTLTMQVARLLEPREERSLEAKLRQMVRAVQLEHRFSKDEILRLYLLLAPFGGNLEGVARRKPVLFRPRAEAAFLCRGGPARGAAAIA